MFKLMYVADNHCILWQDEIAGTKSTGRCTAQIFSVTVSLFPFPYNPPTVSESHGNTKPQPLKFLSCDLHSCSHCWFEFHILLEVKVEPMGFFMTKEQPLN